jgi:hypothetical protein
MVWGDLCQSECERCLNTGGVRKRFEPLIWKKVGRYGLCRFDRSGGFLIVTSHTAYRRRQESHGRSLRTDEVLQRDEKGQSS